MVIRKVLVPWVMQISKHWHISPKNGGKKITFINSPTISLEMSLGFGKLTSSCARHKSPQILIFTWKFKFYHWQQILSAVFPWSDRLTSFIFQTWMATVLSVFFQVKAMFHENSSYFILQLSKYTTAFPWDNIVLFICRNALCTHIMS